MLSDFQTSFTLILGGKFVIKTLLKIPVILKDVATLPSKIFNTF